MKVQKELGELGMGMISRFGGWFSRMVNNHMANAAPRRATKEEAKRTLELKEKYEKWSKLPEGTTDKNKDEE